MKSLPYHIILVLFPLLTYAQTPQTVTMDNNKVSSRAIKPELQFIFPDFEPGRVVLKDRKVINCKLNYNFLLDEVLFIDENGKQMALANPHDVLPVFIVNRLFIPISGGYYEVIE